jgi:hypothetical protein
MQIRVARFAMSPVPKYPGQPAFQTLKEAIAANASQAR